MQSSLPLLVLGVIAMAIVLSIAFLLTNHRPGGSIYDEIGRGGLLGEDEPQIRTDASGAHPPVASAAEAERELEIRQMLGARSERLKARGEPALDLDAETARLLEPPSQTGLGEPSTPGSLPATRPHDPGLVEEVRQLVLARNERRARKGLEQLEVEAEVRRTLDRLEG
jgi:hypothetical protein